MCRKQREREKEKEKRERERDAQRQRDRETKRREDGEVEIGTVLEAPVPERSVFVKKTNVLVKYMFCHAPWNCRSIETQARAHIDIHTHTRYVCRGSGVRRARGHAFARRCVRKGNPTTKKHA